MKFSHRGTVSATALTAAAAVALIAAGPAGAGGGGGRDGRPGMAVSWPPAGLLDGLAATSASNVWAVGQTNSLPAGSLILRWNGAAWRQVPAPHLPPGTPGYVLGVAATSARNAWAVGARDLHWNGRAWTPVPGPGGVLFGVAAASRGSAWAVGYRVTKAFAQDTLIARWNGTAWRQVPSPTPPGGNGLLDGVAIVSARDAWAVGHYGVGRGLIVHWNGTAWKQVPDPDHGGGSSLSAVAFSSAHDGWAVGELGFARTLILHWNGTAWKQEPSPDFGGLSAVAIISARNIWAVGGGLIVHWNGIAWKQVPSPAPGGLDALAFTSARNGWAAGQQPLTGETFKTVLMHWNGTAWKVLTTRAAPALTGKARRSADNFTLVSAARQSLASAHAQHKPVRDGLPAARALDLIGEWWTLLIIRDALRGARRFEEFRQIGISDNILTARLKRLVEAGVFERSRYQERPDRYEYLLTPKGRALGPVVAALREWGSAWTEGPDRTKIAHRPCGHPLSVRLYCPDCDRQVTGAEIGPAD